MRAPRLAVVIATLDEALHIERAVRSALPLGPVVVVDSGSTDGTREIAAAAGAIVVEHPWQGYAAQKNWAREHLPVDADWIMHLDADEVITEPLQREIPGVLSTPATNGYYVARQFVFFGRKLQHAWWYPDYQLRLFRVDKGRYEDRSVHEHVLLDGEAGFLTEPLVHENVKSIDEFMLRHLRYAELEAGEMWRAEQNVSATQRRGNLLGTWPDRRRAIKARIWYRLPGRPAIRFVWMYIIKRGFLDGRPGLVYCQLIAAYEALIDAKYYELTYNRVPRSRWPHGH